MSWKIVAVERYKTMEMVSSKKSINWYFVITNKTLWIGIAVFIDGKQIRVITL